ncbi:Mechanosensitive ion channel [uncultured archaeon]|nr:Mechanosensitive ion channel [uncultured archaeon]
MEPTTLIIGITILFAVLSYVLIPPFSTPLLDIYYGLTTILFSTFRKNDKISLYDEKGAVSFSGYVEKTGLTTTILVDEGNYRYVIPNSLIYKKAFGNDHAKENEIRKYISFELKYFEELDKAKQILTDEAEKQKDRMTQSKYTIKVGAVAPNKLEIRLYYWSTTKNTTFLGADLKEGIIRKFTQEKIDLGNIPKPKEDRGYA